MGRTVVIDFGTTNTVVAEWSESQNKPVSLRIPALSSPPQDGIPSLIPSLLYVEDAKTKKVLAGEEVRLGGFDQKTNPRFFAGFKRAIAARFRESPRNIDGVEVDYEMAGAWFLERVLQGVREQGSADIAELIVTIPVQSFEVYRKWLSEVVSRNLQVGQMRIVDESTAAAGGYCIDRPGTVVLVIDFGGGTLDLSLVRTISTARKQVGWLVKLGRAFGVVNPEPEKDSNSIPQVLGKAGEILGGDDIDCWVRDDVLSSHNMKSSQVPQIEREIKNTSEAVKKRLSLHDEAQFSVYDTDNFRTYQKSFNRSYFEDQVLEKQGFFTRIQSVMDSVLKQGEYKGITKKEIEQVITTGGSVLIPSVQRAVRQNFGSKVLMDKPFEAVAHGALMLVRLDQEEDFLYHSYGVGGWNSDHVEKSTSQRGGYFYDLVIPAGQRYPLSQPKKRRYRCRENNQKFLKIPIGEIEHSYAHVVEVIFDERGHLRTTDNQLATSPHGYQLVSADKVDSLKEVTVSLNPPGAPGRERVEVEFTIDRNRTLYTSVRDLENGRLLVQNQPLLQLK